MTANNIKSYRIQSESLLKTFLYFLNLIMAHSAFKKTLHKGNFIFYITI